MKFVFWGPEFKPARVMLKDIQSLDNVVILDFFINIYILKKIYEKIRIVRHIIAKYLLWKASKLHTNDEMVFCYFEPWYDFLIRAELITYFRETFTRTTHIVLLYDSVIAKDLDIDLLKENYDVVAIYDREDAEHYEIEYFPPFYSRNFDMPKEVDEIIDVSFVGQDRGRFAELLKIYDKLTSLGLICKFFLVDVEKKNQVKRKGITYGNRYLKEEEYYRDYVLPSKCLIEMSNIGTDAITARVREAVMYNKKLLSNNHTLLGYKYYNPKMIQIYDSVESINFDFFQASKEPYGYDNEYSPIHLLETLEKLYVTKLAVAD